MKTGDDVANGTGPWPWRLAASFYTEDMDRKITTIEELGELLQSHVSQSDTRHREVTESFKSIGDHLATIEGRLEELADLHRLTLQVDRIRQHLRERDHVEL